MNSAPPVLLEIIDGIGIVSLNRPTSGNALDIETSRELGAALQAAADDPAVRVVLLRGNGRHFCAGGDLRSMHTALDRGAAVRELAERAHDAVRILATMDKPVVAAVQGTSAGAGLSLVLLADLVVASSQARFVTAYAGIGLTPDCGQSWLLPRAVGMPRALDLTLTSRVVRASEAVAIGLITRIEEEDTLQDAASRLAGQLAKGPAQALGAARRLIRSVELDGFLRQLDLEAETIGRLAASPETADLIAQFAGRQ